MRARAHTRTHTHTPTHTHTRKKKKTDNNKKDPCPTLRPPTPDGKKDKKRQKTEAIIEKRQKPSFQKQTRLSSNIKKQDTSLRV